MTAVMRGVASAALVMLSGCAHRAVDMRPSEAEVRAFYYTDDEGLAVVTTGVQVAQRLPWGDTLGVEVALDAIDLEPVDAVSSASTSWDDDPGLQEQRYELAPSYALALGSSEEPIELSARGRFSSEPDYLSWAGELGATAELCERNTTIAGFVGYGHDTIDPSSFAADDAGRWPDSHERVYGGLALRQLLGKRVDVAGGVSLTWQSGALESPYRRAQVVVGRGFFADLVALSERHPGERTRAVAFLSTSTYLGEGLALHVRAAGYLDSWDVQAFAPELALDLELGDFGLLILGYRFTVQGAASFYANRYDDGDTVRTGDRRLGALDEHLGGFELRWTVLGRPGLVDSLELAGGWQLSLLTYRDVVPERAVRAHQVTLGVLYRY